MKIIDTIKIAMQHYNPMTSIARYGVQPGIMLVTGKPSMPLELQTIIARKNKD